MNLLSKIKNKLEYENIKRIQRISRKTLKKDQFFFTDPWNLEVNNIEAANYFAKYSGKPVYYSVPERLVEMARILLDDKVIVLNQDKKESIQKIFIQSKYILTAHWKYPQYHVESQKVINLWHGIPYKTIGNYKNSGGVFANITVGTSPLTCKIFSKAFNVSLETVVNSGYPRNDILIRTQKDKESKKKLIEGNLLDYEKVLIWLPTLRKDYIGGHSTYGQPIDNAFQVDEFDVNRFNEELKKHNTLCFVKPHPFSIQAESVVNLSNIYFISDQWLWRQGITLYHLVACTDVLISDVSSIIIDYLLLDNPVICLSVDFEKYKEERGFVFDNLEEWMPTQIIKTQEEFFKQLQNVLTEGEDQYVDKRKKLRDLFFTDQNAHSAKRLLDHILDN